MADLTNVKLAIFLQLCSISAAIVRDHRWLLFARDRIVRVLVVAVFHLSGVFNLALVPLRAQRGIALILP